MRRLLSSLIALCVLWPAASAAAEVPPHAEDRVVMRFADQQVGQAVRLPDAITPAEAVRALRRNPHVLHANPDYIASASQQDLSPGNYDGWVIPTDPGPANRPGGWVETQWNFLEQAGVNAPAAWWNSRRNRGTGGRGVHIAVIDTGIAYRSRGPYRASPGLDPRRFLSHGYDYVDRNRFPLDQNGHGTHVASTINEQINDGVGLTGLAYAARIFPIRALDRRGEGNASDIARGIRRAAWRRVHLINLSLEFDARVRARDIPEVLSAIHVARRRGITVIGAAGNEGRPRIAFPARSRGVMAVGATTESLCKAEFSNEGTGLSLVAPGGGADADVEDPNCDPLADRPDITQLTLVGSSLRRFGYPSGYQGTSMAAPHVTGAAALVLAGRVLGTIRPDPAILERHLRRTARDVGTPGYDTRYGAGLLDAAAATDRNSEAARRSREEMRRARGR